LGAALLTEKKITKKQLEDALEAQVLFGGKLGTNLVELGFIEEEILASFLAKKMGVDYASNELLAGIAREVIDSVPADLARRYAVIPIDRRGLKLRLAMSDPTDIKEIAELSFKLGAIIEPMVSPEMRIYEALEKYYEVPMEIRYASLSKRMKWAATQEEPEEKKGGGTVITIKDGLDGKSRILIPTLDEAIWMLDTAADRDQIAEIALSYSNLLLKRTALFLIKRTFVEGWVCSGEGISLANVLKIEIPSNVESIFKAVIDSKKLYLGEVPNNPFSKRIINLIGGKPNSIFLFPIIVKDTVFAIFYGDNGDGAEVTKDDIKQIPQLMFKVGESFERLVSATKYFLKSEEPKRGK
jgi:hypothetical protein